MLYDLFTKVDEFVQRVQALSAESNGGICSLYLTGDLAMHRLGSKTKVQFLLVFDGEADGCLQNFAEWSDPLTELEVISSSNLPLYCPFDYLRFKKARLLWGTGVSIQLSAMTREEEAVVLRQRLTANLLQVRTDLNISMLGDCLEMIFYLNHGFILSKIREYLYNAFYQIPQRQNQELLRGVFLKLLAGGKCSETEIILLIQYIATMGGVSANVQVLPQTMDSAAICSAPGAKEIPVVTSGETAQERAGRAEMRENR